MILLPASDVQIIITRETKPMSASGFGVPMILATSKEHAYKTYYELEDVATDFAESTKEYLIAKAVFGQEPRPEKIAIYGMVYDGITPTSLTTALEALVDSNNDWYFLLCPEQGTDEITALSEWAETKEKLYFTNSNDLTLFTTLTGDRTAMQYHTASTSYPAEAWVGRCCPEQPGSITWKFKTLKGIEPVDITASQLGQLHENGGNTYIEKLGVNQTSEGMVTSGEYIDVIMSQDWIKATMTINVQTLLQKLPKVPYDDSGIALVVAEVEKTLKQASKKGIIAKDADENYMYSVSAPARSEIDPALIGKRTLPDINWEVTIAGAVHTVKINGVLKV